MLGQILLTAAVAVVAYLVIRGRRSRSVRVSPAHPVTRRLSIPPALLRGLAYGFVGLLVLGTATLLIQRWDHARERVVVEVVNANTGQVSIYQARRGDVRDRSFVTVDGQRVTLADVERLVLRAPGP